MTLRAFQCFAAGEHTDMSGARLSAGPTMLASMAAAFDVRKRSAPLVIGHPSDSATVRYGEVSALVALDTALFAIAHVGPDLLKLVRDGRFRKVSASFLLPHAGDNPAPGSHYLRHVGFLGAVAPAVKGMQPLAFAIADEFTSYASSVTSPAESRAQQIYRIARDIRHAQPGLSIVRAASAVERALPNAPEQSTTFRVHTIRRR